MVKAVQVIGFKSSGKSSLVKQLAARLKEKGYSVGVIKHAHEKLLFSRKDEEMTGAADQYLVTSPDHTLVNIPHALGFLQAVSMTPGSFLIVEGFKEVTAMPRIVCLRTEEEKEQLAEGLDIACWRIEDLNNEEKLRQIAELAVEKGLLLAGLDCHGCGHPKCGGLLKEILSGAKTAADCVPLQEQTSVTVNGRAIQLSPFVAGILKETVGGFVRSLKGSTPGEVNIKFELK